MLSQSHQDIARHLSEYLTEATRSTATVATLSPLAGGASRDMWRVDVILSGVIKPLVLRRDLPTSMFEGALSRAEEFALMEAAFKSGIRVAQPRWLCTDPAVLGAPFFLMDYVPGVAIGRKVVSAPELASARDRLPTQMAHELAKIHQLDTVAHRLSFLPVPRAGHSPAQEAIAQCYELLATLNLDHAAFEFALRWAEKYAPKPTRVTFIHGDFRIGNLIVTDEGLQAVADWEFGHMGDPCEDLGYCCMRDWRFGNIYRRMGGISDREPFLRAYEECTGFEIERQAVHFWEFMGNVRWGIICLSQANRHLSGHEVSVELASLGRRSAEMQLEMLHLIDTWR